MKKILIYAPFLHDADSNFKETLVKIFIKS